MSITDELREFAALYQGSMGGDALRYVADRIDAAHRSALEKLAAQLDESGALPMTDENMAEHGWVRGPLDANGEMWRCGDMSDSNWGVIEGIAYENGRWLISGHDTSAPWIPADSINHYHAPTVEDVLREFARECDADAYGITDAKVAEFAARLRLAGDE